MLRPDDEGISAMRRDVSSCLQINTA